MRLPCPADGLLASRAAQAHHAGKLLRGQAGNVLVLLFREIEACGTSRARTPHGLHLGLSPLPVPDIF
jgi:hypothetical protein